MTFGMSVMLVYSTSHALKIEKLLKERTIQCKLIPVPRQLASDCGICIRFLTTDKASVIETVTTAGIETAGLYEI